MQLPEVPTTTLIEVYKLTAGRFELVRRYRRHRVPSIEELEAQGLNIVGRACCTCPGCGRRFSRLIINLEHQCTAGIEQPQPGWSLRREAQQQRRHLRLDRLARQACRRTS
jgi:hypothetical protein